MENEMKFWLYFWLIISIAIVLLSGIIAGYNYSIEKLAFEHGYEKNTLIGTSEKFYQKIRIKEVSNA
jgi:hypothetical protein